jgi:hypothetical protein
MDDLREHIGLMADIAEILGFSGWASYLAVKYGGRLLRRRKPVLISVMGEGPVKVSLP